MKITLLTPTRDRRRQNWSVIWERLQAQCLRIGSGLPIVVWGPEHFAATTLARFPWIAEVVNAATAGTNTLEWHIIQSPEDSDSGKRIFAEYGVVFHHPKELPGHADAYEKWNWFVENRAEAVPGNYIHMLADDDLIPADFYSRFMGGARGPVTICSMYRGQNTMGFHENTPLVAMPENMVSGKIGMEQFIIEADFAKTCLRFDTRSGFEDGKLAERLALEFPNALVYRPDLVVYFNALEAGRWNEVP